MLSSGLPPDVTAQGQSNSWYGLQGLGALTALDLGGSHFSNAVWVRHMCPLLTSCSKLQRLMLAHCSIPPGKMQHLLPGLGTQMVELNIDRCVWVWLCECVRTEVVFGVVRKVVLVRRACVEVHAPRGRALEPLTKQSQSACAGLEADCCALLPAPVASSLCKLQLGDTSYSQASCWGW